MKKLIAESLDSYLENTKLNEELLIEGLGDFIGKAASKLGVKTKLDVFNKLNKTNLKNLQSFAKDLVEGVNLSAKEKTRKSIDSDKTTLELLLPALEDGAKNNFKGGAIKAGTTPKGIFVVRWVPVKIGSSTASHSSGSGTT